MKETLKKKYGLDVYRIEKSSVGAGSDAYFVTCQEGKFVVKYPARSDINHPEAEPELCEHLLNKGIPVCQFLRNNEGSFLTKDESGRQFHVQRFIEGKMYDLNTAPDWLLTESAQMLGKIHAALRDYQELPVGIGADFFKYMTPDRASESYKKSLAIAENRNDTEIIADLQYRIGLMQRFPAYQFDLGALTCSATHGDYFISQIICGGGKINAVIDWTTACVHPVVWEIMRSYVYAAPSCKEGQIDMDEFRRYVDAYRSYAPLTQYDLRCMAELFYYQIAVCDYYGQYYASTADNRHIYLHQAVFSTKLLRWLEENVEALTARLLAQERCPMKFKLYNPEDYQTVCDFLIALNQQNKTHINWNWARWEWMYQHPYCDRTLLHTIGLWKDGCVVVGAAIYDLYHGEAFCAALDGYDELLPEILDYAHRSLHDENGLGIAVNDTDTRMQKLLIGLGYEKTEQTETILCRELDRSMDYELPDGFAIRDIHFPEDELSFQTAIWKGFDHEGDQAELEKMLGNKVLPPHREPNLCLAVVDGAGEFAAHCTCWYDDRTDYAYVEPVCTIPKYRGMGLGKAIVLEALNRCRNLGAKEAFVISEQGFYKKLGFEQHSHCTFYWKCDTGR